MASDQDELAGLLGTRKGKSKADPHLGRKKAPPATYVPMVKVFDSEPHKSTAEMIESLQPMIRKPGQPYPTIPYIDPRQEAFGGAVGDLEFVENDAMLELAMARTSPWPKTELRIVVDGNMRSEIEKAFRRNLVGPIVRDIAAVVLGKTAEIWWPEMTFGPKTQIGPTDV